MIFSDFLFVINWWFLFFLIGLVFLPLTFYFFDKFFDRGYIFSKIIGVGILSYLIFISATIRLLPFSRFNSVFLLVLLGLFNLFLIVSKKIDFYFVLKKGRKIFLFEELIFLGALFFWSFVRSHQPDIHGLEKYMDFGFINSILRSDYFPAPDMWFTPLGINYYYFGHLVTAVLTKISDIPSAITFNLMLSTIFALAFTASFSIGANLINLMRLKRGVAIAAGLLTAFLVTLSGNFHAIYTFFKPYLNENPVPFWQLVFSPQTFPNLYWYPNATRFIYNTIHEFPIYSFVVSDLHGHVLDIPFVLLTLAFLLNTLVTKSLNFTKVTFLSFLLAVMYMTNAWDGIIYLLLGTIIFFFIANKKLTGFAFYAFILGLEFIIFSLPFSLHFKPFASGIGIICAPEFLTNVGKIGPFLLEPNHCQRSPLWQLLILYGFFYFWVFSFIIFLKKRRNIISSDVFVIIIIAVSTLLIIIPEFVYVKDIYPAHYRANTMFKLVYQSFIMLSISCGYIMVRIITNVKLYYWKLVVLVFIGSILLFPVGTYPYFAINSYYGNLQTYSGLNGISYIERLYPSDYQAILWLNKNISGLQVILEAQGDSYTDYARVSANTGLPTVLGWTVHEWLWRGTYDIPAPRISEVQTLYETADPILAKRLIKKYDVSLVFVGGLERQKYTKLQEDKFKYLGKIIFQNGQTKIYKVTSQVL